MLSSQSSQLSEDVPPRANPSKPVAVVKDQSSRSEPASQPGLLHTVGRPGRSQSTIANTQLSQPPDGVPLSSKTVFPSSTSTTTTPRVSVLEVANKQKYNNSPPAEELENRHPCSTGSTPRFSARTSFTQPATECGERAGLQAKAKRTID
mmetsp:Transcript_18342/g.36034  ORF Transcript_18342/g.36034 Transcript_18342/m.36034 type:complete len:150 (+) Transcript_18342:2328-2777(+)